MTIDQALTEVARGHSERRWTGTNGQHHIGCSCGVILSTWLFAPEAGSPVVRAAQRAHAAHVRAEQAEALAPLIASREAAALRNAAGDLDELTWALVGNNASEGYALTAAIVRKCRDVVTQHADRIEAGA